MRKGLRVMGAMAFSLVASHGMWGQSPEFTPPLPGTPVVPLDIPAHVVPPPIDRAEKPAARRFLNTTNARIDYRYGAVGPSGIGKVEIYMTADGGTSWVSLGEDADKESPVEVRFPGEGIYGVRLAITNGNGFGGRAPQGGEKPHFYVEVDASSPKVDLLQPEMAPTLGAIDIRWTAKDANLAPAPVNLFFRTHRESVWQPIAQGAKNDGVYRWVFPRAIAANLYLKIDVTDLAGNITTVETPTPILLDQTEPEATLVNVTGRNPSRENAVAPASIPPATTAPPALPVEPTTPIPLSLPASLPSLPPTSAPPLE